MSDVYRQKALYDAQFLYELSLATNKSLDPRVCANEFLKVLLSKKKLEFGAVWVNKNAKSDTANAFTPLASIPIDYKSYSVFNPDKKVKFDKNYAYTIIKNGGVHAVFRLSDYGFLELFSSRYKENLSSKKLNQIQEVIEQFAKSLEGSISYKLLKKEIKERERVEKALLRSENKYKDLVEQAGDIIYRTDLKGYITFVNDSALKIMGGKKKDYIGKHFLKFVREDYKDQILNFYQSQFEKKNRISTLEFPAITKTGEELWLTQKARVLLDSSKNEVFGFAAIARDITQNVHARIALKRSEEKFRGIIENMNLGLLEVDLDQNILFANKSFCKISGYSQDELINKNASILLKAHENSSNLEMLESEIKKRTSGESGAYELQIVNKNGEKKWVLISGAPVYDNAGNITGSIGIHLDITEQKMARDQILSRQKKLESIVSTSPESVFILDENERVIECNDKASSLFCDNPKKESNLISKIIPERYSSIHKIGIGSILSQKDQKIEVDVINKYKEEIAAEIRASSFTFEGKNHYSVFIKDITLEKQTKINLERALKKQRELNELKSKFVSMTSHEFRTPLTTIRSNIELLSYHIANYPENPKINKNIERIGNELNRITNLMDDILTIGRIESGKIKTTFKLTDISYTSKKMIEASFKSSTKGLNVELKIIGDQRNISTDESIFSHIISNLLGNAIKYTLTNKSPILTIDYTNPQEVVCNIEDFGIGIPEQDLPNLFDSFFRASNVQNITGTGLGLAIVKQFTQLINASISVESEKDKGSTFSLVIPG